jgi:hypothetical protein
MRKARHGRRSQCEGTIDDLEIGWRRLIIIERLIVDLIAVVLLPVSIFMLASGALRVESALATGLSLGIGLGRLASGC